MPCDGTVVPPILALVGDVACAVVLRICGPPTPGTWNSRYYCPIFSPISSCSLVVDPFKMVNYGNVFVITQESMSVIKLWHTVDGLYLWEYVTTLDFEWCVIRGRRPFRWSMIIYSFTRLATLISVTLSLVDLNAITNYDCQAVLTCQLLFGYLALASSSFLIALRVIAIWNRNWIIVALAATTLTVYAGFLIYGITRLRGVMIPFESVCMATNIGTTKYTVIVSLVNDIVLLFAMLLGLLRMRLRLGGRFGLGDFLWKQGVMWLLLATAAEVPPVVLICLNLNDPLDVIFQFPSFITLSIAATRMHRSLFDFGSGSSQNMQDTLPSGITFPKTRPTSMPVGLSRDHVEISVRASREQFPSHTSQTSAMKIDHDESKLSADAPVSSTACRMSREDNSEGGTEKEHP